MKIKISSDCGHPGGRGTGGGVERGRSRRPGVCSVSRHDIRALCVVRVSDSLREKEKIREFIRPQ